MVKKQHFTFEGLFLPSASLKIPALPAGRLTIAMAMSAFFALTEKKIAASKYDALFHYNSYD